MKKMTSLRSIIFSALFVLMLVSPATAQQADTAKTTVPVIKDGQAQVIPAFNDPSTWIRHDLWVETSFDTDGDGDPDRVHVDVTRPGQTDSEKLKLPVLYESSPY